MLFTKTPTDRVSQLGEIALISKIGKWLGEVSPDSPHGMGDDCAVLPASNRKQLLTTDVLTYGQHFDDSVAPQDAGAKLIKRNLSDIAAMGGTPESAVLALLCGPDVCLTWLEQFFEGIRQSCETYGVQIVGGDVSSLPPGQFCAVLTLTGTVDTSKLRNTAKIGDRLYVTGSLGGSILKKHYAFTPRIEEGQWLANKTECSAMMDITDGLAKDLQALLPDTASAALMLDHIPISETAISYAKTTGRSALEHAFCDGEDYELLFALSATADPEAFEAQWRAHFPELKLSRIGQICERSPKGPYLDATTNEALPWTHGFEHLKSE